MKKIPTLFVRTFDEQHNKSITREVTPGMEWVLNGEGIATVKVDGSCCAIIDGKFFRRYDAKQGKTPPIGAIPCGNPDPITGHWPHWIEVSDSNKQDKWYFEAYQNSNPVNLVDGTYEAIGPHFQNNPYKISKDILIKHGEHIIEIPRSFDGIKSYLENASIEGIVFWKDKEPKCKIKRSDFGYKWPTEEATY